MDAFRKWLFTEVPIDDCHTINAARIIGFSLVIFVAFVIQSIQPGYTVAGYVAAGWLVLCAIGWTVYTERRKKR